MLNPYIYENANAWSASLKTNLVSVFEFDEANTSGSIVDSVGNISGSSYSGSPTQVTGKLNTGFTATTTGYAIIPNDIRLTPTGAFSVSIWCKSSDWAGTTKVFASKMDAAKFEYQFFTDSGNLSVYIGDGTTFITKYLVGSIAVSSLGLTNNQWANFIFTWDGVDQNGLGLYVNAVAKTYTTKSNIGGWTSCVNNPAAPMLIGKNIYGSPVGDVDQTSIWQKVATQSDATEVYNINLGKLYA